MLADNSRPELPRPLLPEERAALLAILRYRDFDGRAALLAQAEEATVIGHCGCGCATVDLAVPTELSTAADTPSPLPNEATVLTPGGEALGGVLVFLRDGRLSSLEVYSYDEPISRFPPVARLRLSAKGAD